MAFIPSVLVMPLFITKQKAVWEFVAAWDLKSWIIDFRTDQEPSVLKEITTLASEASFYTIIRGIRRLLKNRIHIVVVIRYIEDWMMNTIFEIRMCCHKLPKSARYQDWMLNICFRFVQY